MRLLSTTSLRKRLVVRGFVKSLLTEENHVSVVSERESMDQRTEGERRSKHRRASDW